MAPAPTGLLSAAKCGTLQPKPPAAMRTIKTLHWLIISETPRPRRGAANASCATRPAISAAPKSCCLAAASAPTPPPPAIPEPWGHDPSAGGHGHVCVGAGDDQCG